MKFGSIVFSDEMEVMHERELFGGRVRAGRLGEGYVHHRDAADGLPPQTCTT